jgi:hypothetical protein
MLLYLVLDRWQVIVIAGILGLIGGGLGYFLFDVVKVRIEAWLNPFADPLGGSYQIIQSLITVGSGGLFGRGLGLGSPGFVPAIHTDFIFTAIIEEHGLLAGLALIGLWGIWLSRILTGVRKHREPFAALLNAGLGFSLGLQAMLIIGGNLRVLPLVGITLPYTSYGGSSLLISCISLGILLLQSQDQGTGARFQAPLQRLHMGMIIAWGVIAVSLGWWTIIRSPELTTRADNPRWAVDSRYSLRGDIVDRDGQVLAETTGSVGSFERVYPEPEAAPVVGYDFFPFGQTGLEESLDGILRGIELQDRWDVAWSYLSRGVSPVGSDVRLTLDIELQQLAMELMVDHRGAIVLIDADTGELLIASSSPSYNPNQLENDWSALLNDPHSPFLNRAIQGRYQPGTALAPFIMAWAIENQWVTMDTLVEDLEQAVAINGDHLTCAIPPDSTQRRDLRQVLIHGCPKPVQELVSAIGHDAYEGMLSAFGWDQPADPDLAEGVGIISLPTSEDELGLAAIGQFNLTLTPLQLARALAALITEGEQPEVQLVDAVRSGDGEWVRFQDSVPSQLVIHSVTSAEIRSAIGTEDQFSYQAMAIAGEPIGWFLGGSRSLGGNFAAVVVLENGRSGEAARMGEVLLEAVQLTSIP